MCGIVGYLGSRSAAQVIIDGLKSLEYRGYDSAGIAVLDNGSLTVIKSKGKIADLSGKIGSAVQDSRLGIGHTRWATHGRPSNENSHPHTDCEGKIAIVHNGIIENYPELREKLKEEGHVFTSETDSEVISHLIEKYYTGDLIAAVSRTIKDLRGAYAIAVISQDCPDLLVAAKKDSPLIVGLGEGEYFFTSDIPAVLSYTRDIIIMDDGEVAAITPDGVSFYLNMNPIQKPQERITWDESSAQKGGYDHFMQKEIFEQPWALRQTLKGRILPDMSGVDIGEFAITPEQFAKISKITVVACGTSYHAGLVGKHIMEKLLRIPVEVEIASEYRYKSPLIDKNTLVIVISQSGETADTIAALRESKKLGARSVAITNVLGSTIAREADDTIFTWAGPEIAVASTKAYVTQLMALYLMTIYFGDLSGKLSKAKVKELLQALCAIPNQVQLILDSQKENILAVSEYFLPWSDTFFIGRGVDYAVSMEGALKLKEISYIHAEAYAAGELKHGTLALITAGVPVISLCTERELLMKTVSNIESVRARGGYIIGIAFEDSLKEVSAVFDKTVYLPRAMDIFSPILTVVPMQLLSYYAATLRGCNVDQPRNLAKSVTVE